MATVGVESIEVWILEKDGTWDKENTCLNGNTNSGTGTKKCNHWKIDGSENASGVINVKVDGLSSDPNVIFASNKPAYTSFGAPSPKAEVELLDIPLGMQAALLGQTLDKNTFSIGSEINPPYVIVEMIGNDIKGGKQHVVFPKAIASVTSEEMSTKEEKGADPKTQSITFTGMADKDGKMVYKGYDDNGDGTSGTFKYADFQKKWLPNQANEVSLMSEKAKK